MKSSFLISGVRCRVKNGRRVRFWEDTWAEDQPLRAYASFPISEDQRNCKVCEFWQADNGWKWEMFSNILTTSTLMKIASTVLTDNEEEDRSENIEGSDEDFTVRKAYERLGTSKSQSLWPGWKHIWKLKV